MLQPIYTPNDLRAACHLRYTWTGWPSGSMRFPACPNDDFFESLDNLWEKDGLRRLEGRWKDAFLQFTFSVKPNVSPTFFTQRVKSRLQKALRDAGSPVKFQRKVAFGTVGDNHRADVEAYIERQCDKESLADERFREQLRGYEIVDNRVNLALPTATERGRYWYNLHLVLVTQHRGRIRDSQTLTTIRDCLGKIAAKHHYGISRASIMPDHLHMALRGNIDESPEEIALSLMNNTAYALRRNAVWQFGYYAGTFGEYDMNAVRRG